MRLRVRSYFLGDEKPDVWKRLLGYFFNLLYRSLIPMLVFFMLLEWSVGWWVRGFLLVVLGFFVFYQFTWEVD